MRFVKGHEGFGKGKKRAKEIGIKISLAKTGHPNYKIIGHPNYYKGKIKTKKCLTCPTLISKWKKYCSHKCYWKSLEGKELPWDNTGRIPWNKGKDFIIKSYSGLHQWVYRKLGKAEICTKCGTNINVVWANKSNEYHKDLDDWLQLCQKHHTEYDKGYTGNRKKIFG